MHVLLMKSLVPPTPRHYLWVFSSSWEVSSVTAERQREARWKNAWSLALGLKAQTHKLHVCWCKSMALCRDGTLEWQPKGGQWVRKQEHAGGPGSLQSIHALVFLPRQQNNTLVNHPTEEESALGIQRRPWLSFLSPKWLSDVTIHYSLLWEDLQGASASSPNGWPEERDPDRKFGISLFQVVFDCC